MQRALSAISVKNAAHQRGVLAGRHGIAFIALMESRLIDTPKYVPNVSRAGLTAVRDVNIFRHPSQPDGEGSLYISTLERP